MKARIFYVKLLCAVVGLCTADVYMHNPRGSNNRLNEQSAVRTNANRLFDSQNNNRGGYNVGDKTSNAAGNNQENQYRMTYFQSGKYLTQEAPAGRSELVVEWTNQHGCGGNEDTDPHKLNCNMVLQYMCQDDAETATIDDGITLRDGSSTDTQTYTEIAGTLSKAQFEARRNNDVTADKGLQEPWFWYDDCKRRERNKGLFTADQNLNGDEAIYTRQNSAGTRRGYECPEERDYFPYWQPTPFIDIAVLAQNDSMCEYYRNNSFNRHPKHRCVEDFSGTALPKHFSTYNNEADCTTNGGTWTEFYNMLDLAPSFTTQATCETNKGDGLVYKWGKPYDLKKIDNHEPISDVCFVMPPEIECQAAGWSRSNHLGNGRDGVPLNYTWVLPYFLSPNPKRCVLRIRYNISTDDYDPYFTDSSKNGDDSPIENNPLVDVGVNGQALRLAVNTAQFGRTFQDRSHVFKLVPRPAGVADDKRIINLNVRGKRGNIVQVYPAVEYDFIPNRLEVSTASDYIHVQWTGSNTHKNGPNGGDGQTGDAGEGTSATDRHNILETLDPNGNFPLPIERTAMFKDVDVVWSYNDDETRTKNNIELILASAGHYECIETSDVCTKSVDDQAQLSVTLDNAPASFPGVLLVYTKPGTYYYICTRNNNFSNRSQKGHIIVK